MEDKLIEAIKQSPELVDEILRNFVKNQTNCSCGINLSECTHSHAPSFNKSKKSIIKENVAIYKPEDLANIINQYKNYEIIQTYGKFKIGAHDREPYLVATIVALDNV